MLLVGLTIITSFDDLWGLLVRDPLPASRYHSISYLFEYIIVLFWYILIYYYGVLSHIIVCCSSFQYIVPALLVKP